LVLFRHKKKKKLRCGYRFDSVVAKAANIVKDTCPDTCLCCNSGNQTFEHWLLECPMFNYQRSKYLCLTDTSLNNINLNTNVNLLNDNSNYNRNSNVENRTENSINNSSTNSITDPPQGRASSYWSFLRGDYLLTCGTR